MAIVTALSAPVRTSLVGENYLKTFDRNFRVDAPAPLRAGMPAVSPLDQYRARTVQEFEQSKATLLDVWA